jgi:hypothetical protein
VASSYVFAGVGGYHASKQGGLAGVFRCANDGSDWKHALSARARRLPSLCIRTIPISSSPALLMASIEAPMAVSAIDAGYRIS